MTCTYRSSHVPLFDLFLVVSIVLSAVGGILWNNTHDGRRGCMCSQTFSQDLLICSFADYKIWEANIQKIGKQQQIGKPANQQTSAIWATVYQTSAFAVFYLLICWFAGLQIWSSLFWSSYHQNARLRLHFRIVVLILKILPKPKTTTIKIGENQNLCNHHLRLSFNITILIIKITKLEANDWPQLNATGIAIFACLWFFNGTNQTVQKRVDILWKIDGHPNSLREGIYLNGKPVWNFGCCISLYIAVCNTNKCLALYSTVQSCFSFLFFWQLSTSMI